MARKSFLERAEEIEQKTRRTTTATPSGSGSSRSGTDTGTGYATDAQREAEEFRQRLTETAAKRNSTQAETPRRTKTAEELREEQRLQENRERLDRILAGDFQEPERKTKTQEKRRGAETPMTSETPAPKTTNKWTSQTAENSAPRTKTQEKRRTAATEEKTTAPAVEKRSTEKRRTTTAETAPDLQTRAPEKRRETTLESGETSNAKRAAKAQRSTRTRRLGEIEAPEYDPTRYDREHYDPNEGMGFTNHYSEEYGRRLQSRMGELDQKLQNALDDARINGTSNPREMYDSWRNERRSLQDQYNRWERGMYSAAQERAIRELTPEELTLIDRYYNTQYEVTASGGIQYVDDPRGTQQQLDADRQALLDHFGRERMNSLLEYRGRQLDAWRQAERNAALQAGVENNGALGAVAGSAYSVLSNAVAGPMAAVDIVRQGFGPNPHAPLNTSSPGFAAQNATQVLRGTVSNEILGEDENPSLGRKILNTVYQTGMSTADSVTAMLIGGEAGGALLGINAATSAAQDITERGGSYEQAVAGGIASGYFEMLFEELSIGNYYKLKETPIVTGWRDFFGNIAKSMGVNASEEVATDVANFLYDWAINGDISEMSIRIRELQEGGLTEEQAKRQYAKELGLQLVNTGGSGALMGLFFGATGSAQSYLQGNGVRQQGQPLQQSTQQTTQQATQERTEPKQIGEPQLAVPREDAALFQEQTQAVQQSTQAVQQAAQQVQQAAQTAQAAAETAQAAAQAAVEPQLAVPREDAALFQNNAQRAGEAAQTVQAPQLQVPAENAALVADQGRQNAEALAPRADSAYTGNNRAVTPNDIGGDANGRGADVLLPRSGERNDRTSAGGQGGAVAGVPGSNPSGQTNRRGSQVQTAIDRQNRIIAQGERAQRVSTLDQGLPQGTPAKRNAIFSEDLYDEKMTATRDRVRSETGMDVIYVAGRMEFVGADGRTFYADAAVSNGKVYINATSAKYSIEALADHEVFHEKRKNNYGLLDAVRTRFESDIDPAEYHRLIEAYTEAYGGIYDAESETAASDLVVEEIAADAYAGMNRAGTTASQYSDIVRSVVESRTGRAGANTTQESAAYFRGDPGQTDGNRAGELAVPREDAALFQENEQESRRNNDRYSIAGERSNTADLGAEDEARRLEAEGYSADEIYRETGWFRGTDGQWRYELDDSGMRYYPNADAQFRRDHPEYERMMGLNDKLLDGSISVEEFSELQDLDRTWGQETNRLAGRLRNGTVPLRDVIDHPILFEAYPELQDIRVRYDDLNRGEYGNYNQETNTITLANGLSREDAEETILHELQHAMQKIEEHARGSSPSYWESVQEEQNNVQAKIQRLANEAHKIEQESGYNDFFEEATERLINGEISRDDFRAEEREWLREHAPEILRIEAEEQRITEAYRNYKNLYADRLPMDLYMNTYGEQEARNTAERRTMNQEQRMAEMPFAGDDRSVYVDDAAAFLDSEIAIQNQIRPIYSDGTTAFREFVDSLSPEARETFDLFYNFYQGSRLTNTTNAQGKHVKNINISAPYLTAQQWNEKIQNDEKWHDAAVRLAESLPENIRENMQFNLDGTITPSPLDDKFKMARSLAQRLVDALPLESIDSTYVLGGKTIEFYDQRSRQSVGGEALRRALTAETRKAYTAGTIKPVSIASMTKDRWGSMGFLATNGKTGASGDLTTLCPQMMYNLGCYYCYRRNAMETGVNNKLVAQRVWYTGEILRMKDSDVKMLNENGGLRIQSFGDWMPEFSAQLADILYDAELRDLQVKIITKEPSMIQYVASLKEQGIGKNLYFNLSADYAFELEPEMSNQNDGKSLNTINPYRPRYKSKDGTRFWKRAMTVEEAAKYREKYPWVNVRIVATDLEEFIRGLKDPRVQVVTGYHGPKRDWVRVDSETGAAKLEIEPLGDNGMPRFLYDKNTGTWTLDQKHPGKNKFHKRLAQAIIDNDLQTAYYAKACCITGRCAECKGICGKASDNFWIKNLTNEDKESVAFWQTHAEQIGTDPGDLIEPTVPAWPAPTDEIRFAMSEDEDDVLQPEPEGADLFGQSDSDNENTSTPRLSVIDNQHDAQSDESRILALESERRQLQEEIDFAETFGDRYFAEQFGEEYADDSVRRRLAKVESDLETLYARERQLAVKTSMQEILDNLENYRITDLWSLAEQISNGAWDEYEDLDRDELEAGLRYAIKERELSPLEMQSKRLGLYVRPVEKADVRYAISGSENVQEDLDGLQNEMRSQLREFDRHRNELTRRDYRELVNTLQTMRDNLQTAAQGVQTVESTDIWRQRENRTTLRQQYDDLRGRANQLMQEADDSEAAYRVDDDPAHLRDAERRRREAEQVREEIRNLQQDYVPKPRVTGKRVTDVQRDIRETAQGIMENFSILSGRSDMGSQVREFLIGSIERGTVDDAALDELVDTLWSAGEMVLDPEDEVYIRAKGMIPKKIYVSPQIVSEFPDPQQWRSFRSEMFGLGTILTTRREGSVLEVDSVWQQLAREIPGVFSEETTDGRQQLEEMRDALIAAKPERVSLAEGIEATEGRSEEVYEYERDNVRKTVREFLNRAKSGRTNLRDLGRAIREKQVVAEHAKAIKALQKVIQDGQDTLTQNREWLEQALQRAEELGIDRRTADDLVHRRTPEQAEENEVPETFEPEGAEYFRDGYDDRGVRWDRGTAGADQNREEPYDARIERLGSVQESGAEYEADMAELRPRVDGERTTSEIMRERAERLKDAALRRIAREDFQPSKSLQKIGVKIEGTVTQSYDVAGSLRARSETMQQMQQATRRAEKNLHATERERTFAREISNGLYTEADIPRTLDAEKIMELAQYYMDERSLSDDLIGRQRSIINEELQLQMQDLFRDADQYAKKKPRALSLNYNTAQRNMISIFGDELGSRINAEIFDPINRNEAERYRFINRMYNEVRTFEGKDGKQHSLTKEESRLAQLVIEGRAAGEMVASMQMMGGMIRDAAESIRNGGNPTDTAREFSLTDNEQQLAEQYARWLQTQEDLKSDKVDAVKVQNAANKYAELFDDLYDAINDFLVVHGYEPIGYIKGYAPHMQSEENIHALTKVLQAFGLDRDVQDLDTGLAGRTKDFRPNKRWDPFFLNRRGDQTNYDIQNAFQSYIDYMSDVLYHTDDIMRLRQMSRYFRQTYSREEIRNTIEHLQGLRDFPIEEQEDYLRQRGRISSGSILSPADVRNQMAQFEEEQFAQIEKTTEFSNMVMWLDNYTNLIAAKQSGLDRSMEELMGRKSLNGGGRLTRYAARAQIAGNISTVLNQAAQIPMVIGEKGVINTAQALRDFAIGRLRRSGFNVESDFLTGKNGVDLLVRSTGDMVTSAFFAPAEFTDKMVSAIAVRAAYLQAIKQGKTHEEALRTADRYGAEVMADRTKGARPTAFTNKNFMMQLVNMFQIEAVNSWEHLVKDLPRDFREIQRTQGKKSAALALAGVIAKALLAALIMNRIDEELYGGTPAPYDVLGIAANFIASGKGLTTNDLIRTIIDNGWEKITGERYYDTDEFDPERDFDWESSISDLLYTASNDIPMVRNVAGLLGWGDQTLLMPDIWGAGEDIYKSVKENGWTSGETGEAVGNLAAQFIPLGRQASKSYQGVRAMVQGGRMKGHGENRKLQYPVVQNGWNWVRAALFGTAGLAENNRFYAGDNEALSKQRTAIWIELVDAGLDANEIYDVFQNLRGVDSDAGRYAVLNDADLSEEDKALFYSYLTTTNYYGKLIDEGVSVDEARMMAWEKAALQAPEGHRNVLDNQVYEIITRSDYSYEAKLSGIKAEMGESAFAKVEAMFNAGVPMEAWYDFRMYAAMDGVNQEEITDYIARMNISREAKNALWIYGAGYKESTLKNTPWH